ncbi:MAG: hypothetical protein OXB84_04735 [Halobacteriovoraceae bacterium]|nr:hypothetical protein [Halobacteriovoraceae bacterium]
MKIAICGSGPLAIEMFFNLDRLGAQVILFADRPLGGAIHRMVDLFPDLSMERPYKEVTSDIGREISNLKDLSTIPTFKDYWQKYLSLLIEKIPVSFWNKNKVLRVQKRFLQEDEEIPGHGRLFDLFRLFYQMKPIDSSIHPSLEAETTPMEGLMDFDVVIDARGPIHCPKALGGDGWALNEKAFFNASDVIYGFPSLEKLQMIKEAKKIVLAGFGMTAALWILKLAPWIRENQLTVVSSKVGSFIDQQRSSSLKKELNNFFEEVEMHYSSRYHTYERLLEDFEKLDDHLKMKKTSPQIPVRALSFMDGCNVMAVDRLSDRKGVFITVETADFRVKREKLQTLHTDFLVVANGYRWDKDFTKGLRTCYQFDPSNKSGRHPEPGFYTLGFNARLSDGIKQVNYIREDILSYFKKR